MQAYLEYLQMSSEEGNSEDSAQDTYNRSLIEELRIIFAWRQEQPCIPVETTTTLHYDDNERLNLVSDLLRNPIVEEVFEPTEETESTNAEDSTLQVLQPDARLNTDQNQALVEVLTWLSCRDRAPTPLRILIHGGPGTGKSFFAGTLIERAKEIPGSGRILCCAPTGIASTLLPGGQTVHSLLKLPIDQTMEDNASLQPRFRPQKIDSLVCSC